MDKYSYCGLNCGVCEYKESYHCNECKASYGKPFHGICELASCAISKHVEYCSLCKEFPCPLLEEFSYDPVHGDKGKRIETLKKIVVKQ
jgi:hypothetical protein